MSSLPAKKASKKSLTSEERRITTRILAAMADKGIKQVELAKYAGIHQTHLSRILKGERGWTYANTRKVAKALDMRLSDLLQDEAPCLPVFAEISHGRFDYSLVEAGEGKGLYEVPCPLALGGVMLAKIYALPIQEEHLGPWRRGTILFAQKDTAEEIQDGDLVIYVDQNNQGIIGKIAIPPKGNLKLTLLDPDHPPLELPRKHLKSMDRIVAALF
ncbi:MAG: helix-turn-helix domain-containing protein [Thermodesulfobacteriota bacterium]